MKRACVSPQRVGAQESSLGMESHGQGFVLEQSYVCIERDLDKEEQD
jgi:hypothetical protein